jgi:hypothetical protein
MDRYIKNIMEDQAKKAAASPSAPPPRRESLIFSGFPSEDSRPSLPVTPAPMLTNTFWGDERGEDDPKLPPAKGVPDQAEWVCPHCGFSSTDPAAFTALHASSFRHDSVVAAEGADAAAPLKDAPPGDASGPAPDVKPSVSRPLVRSRHSSSDVSALSTATTVVPIAAIAEPDPVPEQEPESESEEEPELEVEAEALPPPLLLPPAWLTGAVREQVSKEEVVLKDGDPIDAQFLSQPLSTTS